ncbi:MAG: hypothetical protein EA412_08240 [Chitinophagaceae bacterium]|nr:MAG: hypothetical protein EA412_08240 [Chitinophagaceae bacterium]
MQIKFKYIMSRIGIMAIFLLIFLGKTYSQSHEWETEGASFGFQIQPIIPNDMFRFRGETRNVQGTDFSLNPNPGYVAGAVIRFGVHRRFTLETGINYVRRPYEAIIETDGDTYRLDLRIISYELPLSATYHVRLGQQLYLTSTAGLSLYFLPSNLFVGENPASIAAARRNWFTPSAKAATGFEYRTENSGYFYIGPSYQFFFRDLYLTEIEFRRNGDSVTNRFFISGEYFGLIFRYTFPTG